jgi:hypothetical protein
MPHEAAPWEQPTPDAMALIERVYRLANALRVMGVSPGAARVALIITLKEAFTLLDHIQGPWQMAVWAPSASVEPGIELIHFDLSVSPRTGLKWGLLFGVTLIIEEEEGHKTAHNQ